MSFSVKRKYPSRYEMMTEAPVFGLVLKLSIPTTFSVLITSIYNIADTYFVSSLGNAATGAVGVVYSVQSIIQAVGFGFGMGAQSLISRKLGEKDHAAANLYGSSAFLGSLLMGILIMILGLLDLPFAMHLFGATDSALPLACDYGRIILFGAPVFCSSFVLNNVLRAQGKANISMVGLCSGGVLNVFLDFLFIRVWNMGVSGAALATVLSQCVSFFILLCFFFGGKSIVHINPVYAGKSPREYLTVFRIGLPTVFRQGLGSVATTVLNITVRPYGDAAFAAVSIANKIYMLLRSMLIGVGQGFQPVAGYNFGAKKYPRVKSSFWVAVGIGSVWCLIAAVFLFFFSPDLMAIFRKGDEEVISIGSKMLTYLCFSLLGLGYSTFVNQLFQSLGYVKSATFLASCRQGIFFLPALLLLSLFFGLEGVLWAQACADVCTLLISVPFQIAFFRQKEFQLPGDASC